MSRTLLRKRLASSRTRARVELDLADAAVCTYGEVVMRLKTALRSPGFVVPELPAVAPQIVTMSRRQNVRIAEIVALLERDSNLAARVLRTVRSPLYASVSPVRSLSAAVIRLGLNTMRNVVLETALAQKVFCADSLCFAEMEQLRRHSSAVGFIARALANHGTIDERHAIDGDLAFMCGLLHDVGAAALLMLVDQLPDERKPPSVATLWPAIDALHERTSGTLCRAWRFSDELNQVISSHHKGGGQGRVKTLRAIVAVSESLAAEFGEGASTLGGTVGHSVDVSPAAVLADARAHLGLTAAHMDLVYLDVDEIMCNLSAHLDAMG